MHTLADLRRDFEMRSKRAMSMPLAGMLVWTVIGVLGWTLPPRLALLAMMAATGAIFPLALLIARWRREELMASDNPLSKLMGMCVLMVNLLWAVHLPLYFGAPDFVPLTLGIALGLHWVVYSWIIGHPLGLIHASARALLLLAAWYALPGQRVLGAAIVIVAMYAVTLVQMGTRRVPA